MGDWWEDNNTKKMGWYFEDRYPRWKCPNCGTLNRYADGFFEVCRKCEEDHTLDWEEYVYKE